MKTKTFSAEPEFVPVHFLNGRQRLFAVAQETGRPLVLLHGGLADHRATLHYLTGLDRQIRLIAPDVRGAGQSHYDGVLSWKLLASDLKALLDYLGLQQAFIGGMSAGCPIALRFALDYPKYVAGLILVHPIHAGDDFPINRTARETFEYMSALGARTSTEGIEALHPLFAHLPEQIKEKAMSMIDSFDAPSVATTTKFLSLGLQPFASANELKTLSCKALLIPGVDDVHPKEIAIHLSHFLSSSTLYEGSMTEGINQFVLDNSTISL